jgi:hypothetical protein
MTDGFTLNMGTGNDAFFDPAVSDPDAGCHEDARRIEIARILRHIACALEDGNDFGQCIDLNGNMVGKWSIC